MVEQWVKDLVAEVSEKTPLEIGKRYHHHTGRVVEIVGGQYWGEHGLSNFWYWRPVMDDGSFGPKESGYDNEGLFTPIEG